MVRMRAPLGSAQGALRAKCHNERPSLAQQRHALRTESTLSVFGQKTGRRLNGCSRNAGHCRVSLA